MSLRRRFQRTIRDFEMIGQPGRTWWQNVRPAEILVGIPLSTIFALCEILAAFRVIPPIEVNGKPYGGAEALRHLPVSILVPLLIVAGGGTMAYIQARVKQFKNRRGGS